MIKKNIIPKYWLTKNKEKISCEEKIKVMKENIIEFDNLLTDIYDEAILIGVDKKQIKKVLVSLVNSIESNLKSEK